MKTTKLIIGIISVVLFGIILFQSCVVGIGDALLEEEEELGGSAGIILAICMLIAGIIGIAARKSLGGSITAGVFYLVGGLIGIANVGSYSDLKIWSIISFIFAFIFIVGSILENGKKKKALKAQEAPEDPAK